MKKILFFAVLLFIFVFVKSKTWDSYTLNEDRGGTQYASTVQSFHWERFFDYLQKIPDEVSVFIRQQIQRFNR